MNTKVEAPSAATDGDIDDLRVHPTGRHYDHELDILPLITRIDQDQIRIQGMAEVLTTVRSSCVRWGAASLVEVIDAAIAGIPPKPTTEQLSPTVHLDILTQTVGALVRGSFGEAARTFRQLGQEVR